MAIAVAACSSDEEAEPETTAARAATAPSTSPAGSTAAADTSASPTTPTTATPTTAAPTTVAPTTGVPRTDAPMTVAETTPPTGTLPAPPAPEGEAFWRPPDPLPEGEPGDVIWRRQLSGVGGEPELVMYRSTDVAGDPIAVTALVYVPDVEVAPGDALPVLALAHGTTGIADECAPTTAIRDALRWARAQLGGEPTPAGCAPTE